MEVVDVRTTEHTVAELKAEVSDGKLFLNVGELKEFLRDIPDHENIRFPFKLDARCVNLKDTHLTDLTFRQRHLVSAMIYEDNSEEEITSDVISCEIKGYICKAD